MDIENLMENRDIVSNNKCDHICSSNCRRVGCNCECGEFHIDEPVLENLNELEEQVAEESKLRVKCECEEPLLTDDDSDSSPEAHYNGNIPMGYTSDNL